MFRNDKHAFFVVQCQLCKFSKCRNHWRGNRLHGYLVPPRMPSDIPTKNLGPPRIPTNIPTKNYVVFFVLVHTFALRTCKSLTARHARARIIAYSGSRLLFREYFRDSLRRYIRLHILTTWLIIIALLIIKCNRSYVTTDLTLFLLALHYLISSGA